MAFTLGGKLRFVGHINARSEVAVVRTWVDNPVLDLKVNDVRINGAATIAVPPEVANAPAPSRANPYAVNLHDNIRRLGLDVEQIAALHGPRVVTLADLRLAIGEQSASR